MGAPPEPALARRRVLRWGLLVALAWALCLVLGLGSCLSPTLPLPPPSEPEIEAVGEGAYRLSGMVPEPDEPVVAWNMDTDEFAGQMSDAQGRYSFLIGAEIGHSLALWYEVDDRESLPVRFVIPAPPIPPMPLPTVTAPAAGVVTLEGTVPRPLAAVVAENPATGDEVTVASDGDGLYTLEIPAESGDTIALHYVFGLDESDVVEVEVP